MLWTTECDCGCTCQRKPDDDNTSYSEFVFEIPTDRILQVFPPNMLSQQCHGCSPWIWAQSGWTLGASCWVWMRERWWGTGPRCCLSAGHRIQEQVWAACHRTSWRNIPCIFLPLTVKLKGHICLESATFGVLGAWNVVILQLLETMKRKSWVIWWNPQAETWDAKGCRCWMLEVFISQ